MPEMRIMMGHGMAVANILRECGIEPQAGDTRVMWDSNQNDEVKQAKKTFDKLKEKGYMAYAVQDDGGKGEIIREFDPQAGKIILAPPMAGG